ncbi:hypothetical protein ID866_10150, partial [Astraeus odoratus]
MSTIEQELQIIYDDLLQVRRLNYVTAASTAFLVYDILTNLDKEIPLIWRYYHDHDYDGTSWSLSARRALIQALFIFGRYYAPLYLIGYFIDDYVSEYPRRVICTFVGILVFVPEEAQYSSLEVARPIFSILSCEHPENSAYASPFIPLRSAGEILYTTLVNVIMAMRINALYQIFNGIERLRKYQLFLAALVIVEFVTEIVICVTTAIWLIARVVEPPAGIAWPGCMISENPDIALTLPSWPVAILVTTIFVGLTLHLLFSSIKWRFKRFSDFTIANIEEEMRNIQPMTLLLVRDGVFFYFPIFGVLVSSAVIVSTYRSPIANIVTPILMALYSFVV